MAASVRIDCVNKGNRTNPHEAITHIGGVNPDGSRWKLTLAEAIKGIDDGKWDFHVERPAGHRVRVVVTRSAAGHRYLKTEADGEMPNNLLFLPECP